MAPYPFQRIRSASRIGPGNLLIYVKDKGRVDFIHPEYVAHIINLFANSDAVFSVDTGMCCVWGARYIEATDERRLLDSFNHGSMANAMPQAIGAAFACPGRQVIAFCGDGGLSMSMGDLATIVQYKLPIKIIVFNNRSLGMVKLEMEVMGLPEWQTKMYNPDFALIAEAMGLKGFTLRDPDLVEETIIKVLGYDGPALVNVFTDSNALAMPPKIDFKQITGMATAMYKMVMEGEFWEVVEKVKANYKHAKELM